MQFKIAMSSCYKLLTTKLLAAQLQPAGVKERIVRKLVKQK